VPAGYSATPTARKLGIKEGSALALIGAPRGWSIEGLPDGVTVRDTLRGTPDVVVAFAPSLRALRRRLPSLVRGLPAASALWLAWPRKAAGHESDVTENALRDLLLPTGLVDVKVAAVDHDWSGLKFVWRKECREERRQARRSAGGAP
jgi:hypothetical protein